MLCLPMSIFCLAFFVTLALFHNIVLIYMSLSHPTQDSRGKFRISIWLSLSFFVRIKSVLRIYSFLRVLKQHSIRYDLFYMLRFSSLILTFSSTWDEAFIVFGSLIKLVNVISNSRLMNYITCCRNLPFERINLTDYW